MVCNTLRLVPFTKQVLLKAVHNYYNFELTTYQLLSLPESELLLDDQLSLDPESELLDPHELDEPESELKELHDDRRFSSSRSSSARR